MNTSLAYTHGGTFHSDDIFSTVLVRRLFPGIEVQRVFKVPEDTDALVYDIGLGAFDHHQKEPRRRPDGTPYAAFGLLWAEFGHLLAHSSDAKEKFDRDFVYGIDAADNGVSPSALAAAIGAFNPNWDDTKTADEAFWEAVSVAEKIFDAALARAISTARAETIVREKAEAADDILVLDEFVPWQDVVVAEFPRVMFVCFPSNRGGWNVQTVPDAIGSFTGRMGFPAEWLGSTDEELGMHFCHRNNFLACTHTREQAVNLAAIAIKRGTAAAHS